MNNYYERMQLNREKRPPYLHIECELLSILYVYDFIIHLTNIYIYTYHCGYGKKWLVIIGVYPSLG